MTKVVTKKILFDYYFKLPNGVYVNGRNEVAPDERTLEVVRWDDNYLWLNQYYVEYGHPETMRIRLQRVCNKSWEGTWEQDRPENHGRMTLTEVNPNTFLGEQTWKDGERASCHITRTK